MNSIVRYLARVAGSTGLYGSNLLEHTEVRRNHASLFFPFPFSPLFWPVIKVFVFAFLFFFIVRLRFQLCGMLRVLLS